MNGRNDKSGLNPSYSGKRSRGAYEQVRFGRDAASLNPSYSGKRSRGPVTKNIKDVISDNVLTLLILENGLGVSLAKGMKNGEFGLNPSYSGKRSRGTFLEYVRSTQNR